MSRPTFNGSHLVHDSLGGPFVGVTRRDRHVWRIWRFGIADADQPTEAFAAREEAGARLLELAAQEADTVAT